MISAKTIARIYKTLISLLILIQGLFQTNVHCLWRSVRSVETCHVSSPEFSFSDQYDCERNCITSYFVEPHIKGIKKNQYLAKSQFHGEQISDRNEAYHRTSVSGKASKVNLPLCCCLFEFPWEDPLRPEQIGYKPRKASEKRKKCTLGATSILLSKQTRESYEKVCNYVQQGEPLTILELLEFAAAAYHLNYMHPRNPSIQMLRRRKRVKSIDEKAYEELKRAQHDYLLDHRVPLEQRDGYNLATTRLSRFLKLNHVLHNAKRSRVVQVAVSEYVISLMLVDLAAAVKHLKELNEELHIPLNLIRGHYNKYDKNLANEFTMPLSIQLDCKRLSKTITRLHTYLEFMKSLSNYLPDKGSYEKMERNYGNLKDILGFKEIYENLFTVNCKTTQKTMQNRLAV